MRQPDILFIFSDDHASAAISAYGEKRRLLETPHLDRLAREGMRFDRCLVPNSICGPSRATILTGKYSHRNGFFNNSNCRFDGAQTTFPKLMQAAGYQTAIVGKWHLIGDPTGFDYWNILPGQGIYYNPPMIRNGEKTRHEGYVTDIITDLSIEWLKNRDKTKPFVLMAQHKAPHREWSPALRHLGHDKDRPYPEPETLFDDYGVVTDRYKLVHYYTPDLDDWELYDREKDPLETRNFIGDPSYGSTVTGLRAELARLRAELKVPDVPPREAYGNARFDNEPEPAGNPGKRPRKRAAN
ncbi:MAG: hypothetical protein BWK77_08960 [Verrucomicrobia bacterium A1]|nr:MAG: hypothetical protein BWK77_08960 [Verrucomicrobia bacterium A1]